MSWWTKVGPVGAALPEPLDDVLVVYEFDGEPTIDLAYKCDSGKWVLVGSEPELSITPTHWMPLPALPI